MDLASKYRIIPIIESEDYAGAGKDGDSINMKNAHKATFIFNFGDITGNSILTIYSGATAGAKTTALTFKYALAGADTGTDGSDVLGTASTSAALTLTAATYDHKMLIVEVDAANMNLASDYEYLTVEIDATANPMEVGCVAIVDPRYSGSATFLA